MGAPKKRASNKLPVEVKAINLNQKMSKSQAAPKRDVWGSKAFDDQNKHWYVLPTEQVANAIKQIVIQIDRNNKDITNEWETYAGMYGNYSDMGFNSPGGANNDTVFAANTNLPSYNVIQSSVDTLNSKIAKDNPKPYFITSGADYFTKLKAEKQTQFVQGVFQETDFYNKINNQVFRDGALYGLGAIKWKIDRVTNKPACDWVFVDDIKIDRVDAMKKKPRSIHLCSLVQKECLEADYPDSQQEIDRITTQRPDYMRSRQTVVEFMIVTESWHLQNGDKPGRHVVSVEDVVLLDEEYNEDYFPVVFFNLYDKTMGLFGRGLGDTLYSDQIEINKQLLMIQQCIELQAAPMIFVPTQAQISADVLLSNNISRMIPYNGMSNPPTPVSPQACDPALYEWVKWWISAAYEKAGISITSASGTKQEGVDSAVAMRTLVDIESGRWIQVSKNWESFICQNAEVVMKVSKRVYEKNKSFSVRYMDKKSKIIKDIPWSKVMTPDDSFVIQCDTISSFASSMSGKISTILDFFSQGIFSQPRTLEMLGMDPDIDEEYKLQTASLRLCEKRLSAMVEDNIYQHPEPYMDLKLAQRVSQMTYEQLQIDECPEERLQLVRQWIGEIMTMLGSPDPTISALQNALNPPPPTAPVAPQAGVAPVAAQQ
jgi:hypothetical protein